MNISDSISLSFRTIKGNRLRTSITIIIIALGIMSLIAIVTAIAAVNISLTQSFSTMGANAFSLRYKERHIQFGDKPAPTTVTSKTALKARASSEGKLITYDEARMFKKEYAFPAKVSIALPGPSNIVVNDEFKKTNPDVRVVGGDENYLEINGYTLAAGRSFDQADVESGMNICILGYAVAQKLYGDAVERAVNKTVTVANIKYLVIGVLQSKGSSAFFNADKIVLTTYNNVRSVFGTNTYSYTIAVMVSDFQLMDAAIGQATGTFRPIRKLDIKEADNFYIDKSDSIAASLMTNLGFLQYATMAIAMITLVGAAIGLMNIMLVAVGERTKEIGLIKAIGGRSADIRAQFLWESILISLMGAVVGIIAGILLGNVVALLVNSSFIVPWVWVVIGIFVCSLVGILAGSYPAYKAAKLDPIVALRYE